MASGLILLSIGFGQTKHEEMNKAEITGIILMIHWHPLSRLSELSILPLRSEPCYRPLCSDPGYHFLLPACSLLSASRSLALRSQKPQRIVIVLGNGFLACLSDFWINPLLALIVLVLAGQGTNFQTFFFIMSAAILASPQCDYLAEPDRF